MFRLTNLPVGETLRVCLLQPAGEERPRREGWNADVRRRNEDLYRVTPRDVDADEVLVPSDQVERKLADCYELPVEDLSGEGSIARCREGRERARAKQEEVDAAITSAKAEWEAGLRGLEAQLLSCCMEGEREQASAGLAAYRTALSRPPPIRRGSLVLHCHTAIASAHVVEQGVLEAIAEGSGVRVRAAPKKGQGKKKSSLPQTGLGCDVGLAIPQLKEGEQQKEKDAEAAAQKKAGRATAKVTKAVEAQQKTAAAEGKKAAKADSERVCLQDDAPGCLRALLALAPEEEEEEEEPGAEEGAGQSCFEGLSLVMQSKLIRWGGGSAAKVPKGGQREALLLSWAAVVRAAVAGAAGRDGAAMEVEGEEGSVGAARTLLRSEEAKQAVQAMLGQAQAAAGEEEEEAQTAAAMEEEDDEGEEGEGGGEEEEEGEEAEGEEAEGEEGEGEDEDEDEDEGEEEEEDSDGYFSVDDED